MLDVQVLWSASAAPAADEALLSPEEQARSRALTRPADRDRFRTAHVLARMVVARLLAVETTSVHLQQTCVQCGGPHGKPIVGVADRADTGTGVSMSGADGVVVVAAASASIGVDQEPRGAAHRAVADVALTDAERTQLAALPIEEQPDGLLRWWVRKEAVLKMTGHGLLVDPSRLSVSPPGGLPRLLAWDGPGPPPVAQMADLDIDGFVGALAVATHESLRVAVEPAWFSGTPG